MKISVIIANRAILDPVINPENLQNLGTTWASWHQWHQCHPKNILCHSIEQAKRLVSKNFHSACNFWTHDRSFVDERPINVSAYGGDFVHEIPDPEEIIALWLTSSSSDIIVLVGFDWESLHTTDSVQLHQRAVRDDLIKQVIGKNEKIQWVIADASVPDLLKDFKNVTSDTLENMLTKS